MNPQNQNAIDLNTDNRSPADADTPVSPDLSTAGVAGVTDSASSPTNQAS